FFECRTLCFLVVIAGLDPAIHREKAFGLMDARGKAGRDEVRGGEMREFFVSMLLGAAIIATASPTYAADIQEKIETCKACHGENGVSQMENVPSLAGQLD